MKASPTMTPEQEAAWVESIGVRYATGMEIAQNLLRTRYPDGVYPFGALKQVAADAGIHPSTASDAAQRIGWKLREVQHGTWTMYANHRCHCDPCREAGRAQTRKQAQKRSAEGLAPEVTQSGPSSVTGRFLKLPYGTEKIRGERGPL